MNYCIQYHKSFRYLDKINEIIITYKDKEITVVDFLKTIDENIRVILDISQTKVDIDSNLQCFLAARGVHKNLAIKISLDNKDAAMDLYEHNIPFFFDTLVDNWDTVISFIKYNVSDIYIVNELGFELKDIAELCHNNKVKVRVFPNVAQTSSKINNIDTIKSFFIRPEDIELYEPYVDVCEFFGPLDRQSVLYDIYTDKRWHGNLEQLIIGLKTSINNKNIIPAFGEKRVNCKKKCYQNNCALCDKILLFVNQLDKANLELVIKNEDKTNEINDTTETTNENEPNTNS